MKKKLVKMASLVCVLVMAMSMLGCGNKLVGSWSTGSDSSETVYTFNSDGTGNLVTGGLTLTTEWTSSGSELNIKYTILGMTEEVKYTYSISDKQLSIQAEDDETALVLQKK